MSATGGALAEDLVYKGTTVDDIVVLRKVTLFSDYFEISKQDGTNVHRWLLDYQCKLEPGSIAAIEQRKVKERPKNTATLVAAFSLSLTEIIGYTFAVSWHLKWAASGYTRIFFCFEKKETAEKWYNLISGRIQALRAAHYEAKGTASSASFASEAAAAVRSVTPEPLPTPTETEAPVETEDEFQDIPTDEDDEDEETYGEDVELLDEAAERWIPFRHTNGLAVYRRELPDGGVEHMVSCTVHGSPRACLDALTSSNWSITVVGPSRDVVVLDKSEDGLSQVLRIVLEAEGFAGSWCAPRVAVIRRVVTVNDEGYYTVLFNSEEGHNVSTDNRTGVQYKGFYKKPVPMTVHGLFTISPLEQFTNDIANSPESLLKCTVQVDLGGSLSGNSWLWQAVGVTGLANAFIMRMLMSTILVKDAVEHKRFNRAASHHETAARTKVAKKMPVGRIGTMLRNSMLPGGGREPSVVQVKPYVPGQFSLDNMRALSTCDPKYWKELHVRGEDAPFQVRGPTYLKDRKKVTAGSPAFALGSVELIALDGPTEHLAKRLPSILKSGAPFSLLVNLIVPGTPLLSLVFVLVTEKDVERVKTPPSDPMGADHGWTSFDFVFNKFLYGTDEDRNSTFKLIPHVAEGSWVMKQSVGTTPVMIGKKLKTTYYRGPSYIEMDIDVSANSTAAYVTGMVRSATSGIAVDLGFVLQGDTPWELPEELLGAVRISHLDLTTAKHISQL